MNEVILVNEADEQIGTMEKMEAHRQGVLHRAFSIFVFAKDGRMLLQKRADDKYHSGGLWTNTCCSHPAPGTTTVKAASQRLNEEMGFTTSLLHAFTFIYKAPFSNGLTEHELDHVFIGYYDGEVHPDPGEVKEYNYFSFGEIRQMLEKNPENFTAWFRIAFPLVENHIKNA